MFNVETSEFHSAWDILLDHLLGCRSIGPRGMATREETGVVLRITDMTQNILGNSGRNLNYKFMVAEWLWIAFGKEDLETIMQYNRNLQRTSDDGRVLAGAYGPRIVSQWGHILNSLQKDLATRQAVLTIWNRNPAQSKDIPCTVSMQFLARDGKLNCITTMRSSDIWLGLPYDVFTFSMIAQQVAVEFNLDPGYLQVQLGSSHLYERDLRGVEEARRFQSYTIRSPKLDSRLPPILNDVLENPLRQVKESTLRTVERTGMKWDDVSALYKVYAKVLGLQTRVQAREALKDLEEQYYGTNPRRPRRGESE